MKGGRYEKDKKTGEIKLVEQMGKKPDPQTPDPKQVKVPEAGQSTGKDKE